MTLKLSATALLTALLLTGCRDDDDSGATDDSGIVNDTDTTFTPDSHLGTWLVDGENENEILMFTFFDDGTYLHVEYDAEQAGDEPSGMEWGQLTVNDDGVVTVGAHLFDGNSDTGLTDLVGTSDLQLAVSGDTLTLNLIGGEDAGSSFDFTRLESSGAQGTFRTTETENELLAFTFLPNSTYCHFEFDDNPGDEVNGMECSAYTIDADDVLSHSASDVLVDNNGSTGLTDFIDTSDLKVTFSADAMTIDIVGGEEAGDTFSLARLP